MNLSCYLVLSARSKIRSFECIESKLSYNFDSSGKISTIIVSFMIVFLWEKHLSEFQKGSIWSFRSQVGLNQFFQRFFHYFSILGARPGTYFEALEGLIIAFNMGKLSITDMIGLKDAFFVFTLRNKEKSADKKKFPYRNFCNHKLKWIDIIRVFFCDLSFFLF